MTLEEAVRELLRLRFPGERILILYDYKPDRPWLEMNVHNHDHPKVDLDTSRSHEEILVSLEDLRAMASMTSPQQAFYLLVGHKQGEWEETLPSDGLYSDWWEEGDG